MDACSWVLGVAADPESCRPIVNRILRTIPSAEPPVKGRGSAFCPYLIMAFCLFLLVQSPVNSSQRMGPIHEVVEAESFEEGEADPTVIHEHSSKVPIAILGRAISMEDSNRRDLSSSKGGQQQAFEKRIESLLAEKERDGQLIQALQAEQAKLLERLDVANMEVKPP